MNTHLEQLIALAKIDKEIDSFTPQIQEAERALREELSAIKSIENKLTKIAEEAAELEEQKRRNDESISEFKDKLIELGKKSAAVKNEKEANALKIEEDIAREQLDAANEEINRLDKALVTKAAQKEELGQKKEALQAGLAELEAAAKATVEKIEKERKAVSDKKGKLVEQLNQKVLGFYEKIRKWAKNTAVVPVRKQACYGCFMKIYDRTYLAVARGEEIITCPHCGRILYKDLPDEVEVKTGIDLAPAAAKKPAAKKTPAKSPASKSPAAKTPAKTPATSKPTVKKAAAKKPSAGANSLAQLFGDEEGAEPVAGATGAGVALEGTAAGVADLVAGAGEAGAVAPGELAAPAAKKSPSKKSTSK